MSLARISRAMDYITGKRWFYGLLYALGFLVLLPYASKGYSWQEMWDVIKEVVAYRAIIYGLVELAWPSALLHVLALALIAAVAIWGERAARAFDIYVFAVYLMMAVGQGVGFSERYGLAVLTGNIVSWVVSKPPIVDVPAKITPAATLRITEGSLSEILRYVLVFMPAAALLLGLAVYLRRRSRDDRVKPHAASSAKAKERTRKPEKQNQGAAKDEDPSDDEEAT